MAATNSNFVYGNWNPVRSSSNNIFIKSGKAHKKPNLRCGSQEYPIISSRMKPAAKDVRHGHHHHLVEEERWCSPIYSNVPLSIYNGNGAAFMGSRNGYQYRSNPHITFSDKVETTTISTDDCDVNSATYDKSSCNPVRLAVSRNSNRSKRANESHISGQQQIQKWKNELTAAASGLPRKWCDFVFRRNEDNRVYRSESFRFIQKTNSLALLAPASAGAQRTRPKRVSNHGISVNDDYIDPVDHILSPPEENNPAIKRVWSTSTASGDTSSGSRTSGIVSESTSTSTHLSGDDGGDSTGKEEPPYHEIPDRYNAPYYYSDTLKEPTYISPCEDEGVQSPSVSCSSNASSPSPAFSDTVEPVTVTVSGDSGTALEAEEEDDGIASLRVPVVRKHNKLNRRSAYLRGSRELMARKRYETAFLPSSSPHSSSQTTPDIDSLLVAIESSCQLGHGYVSKTDITQPKSTSSRKCFHDMDYNSGAKSSGDAGCTERRSSEERDQPDGGVEQRIIYISHPSSSSSDAVEKTLEQRSSQQVPSSSNPVCFPGTTIISSSNFLPQASVSYRSSNVEESEIGSNASLQTNPSISYCQQRQSHHHFQHHHHPHHLHHNLNLNLLPSRASGLCTTTNSSPLAPHKASKPMLPLSEPLPQKRYITKSNSSSGHATTSSSSSSGPGESRRLGHNLKDNSVSSLESIDSTKSEDLPSSSLNRHSSNYCSSHYQPQKLLSPISDKSPLEPGVALASQNNAFDGSQDGKHNGGKWPNTISLRDAAELTNVPWEMPKLRRKLARLADSGISLDFAGSGAKETDCTAAGRASLDFGARFGTSSTQQGGVQGHTSSQCKREASTSLQLNFDDDLTQDEYYEDPHYTSHEGEMVTAYAPPSRQGFLTASKIPGSAIVEDVTSVQVHVSQQQQQQKGQYAATSKPDRCRMKLDFNLGGATGFGGGFFLPNPASVIDPTIELERQDWFHGAITRCEAENILRATKEGSFLVRNCESTTYNRYSLSLKSFRGCIHIRIEPNSLGTFSLGDQEFPSVPHLVLHFMSHRLPIKGAEHVRLMYPVITQLL